MPELEDSVRGIGRRLSTSERMDVGSAGSGVERMLQLKLDFLTFFISAFATYRITVLISRDVGPWGLCKKLRQHSKLAKCPYCTSVYVGSLVTVGLWISGFIMALPMWVILSLAFSASSIVLDRCFSSDYLP